MKKMRKAGIALLVCAIIATTAVVGNELNRLPSYDEADFSEYHGPSYEPITVDRSFEAENAFTCIAQNSTLGLWFNSEYNTFYIQGNEDKTVWNAGAPGDLEDKDVPRALFTAVIANKQNGNTKTIDNVKEDCTVTQTGLQGGVQLTFSFSQYQLSITMQLFLDDTGFLCRLPLEGIQEGDSYYLISINVLPFFGSVADGPGYILFPDGAGTLYRFGEGIVNDSTMVTLDLYGARSLDLDELEDNRSKKIRTGMLPTYGVKHGEGAFVAYVCEGDVSSAITLASRGHIYDLERVYSTSIYRRVTTIRSEWGVDVYHIEDLMRGNDYCIKFFFSEKNADYSWMAQAVRQHLLEENLLNTDSETYQGAYVELLMGAAKKGMLGNQYVTMTSTFQAQQIINELLESGGNMTAALLGWQKSGYGATPNTLAASSAIGGQKGVTGLSHDRATVVLDLPVIFGNTESTGSQRRRDAVINARKVTVIGTEDNSFVLNAHTQYLLLNKTLKGFKAYSGKGLLLTGVAELLYEDYNKKNMMTRGDVKIVLQAMMKKAKEEGPLVVPCANAYALPYADFLTNMPEKASGYALLEESVPFYYLVVNGSVPYALDTAGNLSSDLQQSKLRWIEYGAVPYFLLTWESGENLKDTTGDHFFSTCYEEQKDQITALLDEFSNLSRLLKGQRLCAHEQIKEDVMVSRYSGGSYIIVNYSNESVTVDGIRVEARDYRLVG